EDRDALPVPVVVEAPAHAEALCDLGDAALERGPVRVQLCDVEADALKELPGDGIRVLVGVEDVRPVPVEQLSERGDEPLAVGTSHQEGAGVAHQGSCSAKA